MKVLFVCLEPFPNMGACSNILNHLLSDKRFSDYEEIHVLALSQTINKKCFKYKSNVIVHQFVSTTRMTKRQLIRYIPLSFIGVVKELIYRLIGKGHLSKHFYNDILYGETIAELERIHANQFDVIIPVSGYYEAVASVLDYKKRHNNVKVIAYQLDPCATNHVMSEKSCNERFEFENNMIKSVNAVITTPILKEEMVKLFAEYDHKSITALEFPLVDPIETKKQKSTNSIICMFTGKIYLGARDPRYTVELFSKLKNKNIKLVLIGVEQEQLRQYLGDKIIADNIICMGSMSIADTKEQLKNANFVVNIDNIVKNQLPSKLFEYISTCKPIINICNSKDSPSINYVNKYPLSISLFPTNESIDIQIQRLEQFIENNINVKIDPKQVERIFYDCTVDYCAKIFCEIINKCIDQ